MATLMARYRQIAIQKKYSYETLSDLIRLVCIAGRKGPEAELEFLELLYDPSELVRFYAAFHALNLAFAIEEPLRVLQEIASSKGEFAAYAGARIVLWREVRDGDWPPDRHRRKRQQRPHVH